MSYVRGFHKSTRSTGGEYSKPVALRGTGTLTVVLAVFHNAVLGKSVTLAITLWAVQEAGPAQPLLLAGGNGPVHRGGLRELRPGPRQAEEEAPGRGRGRP